MSVKIWLIQYNLSEFAHFVSEYIKRASSRHHSYFLLSSNGQTDAKPHQNKNQVSDPEHGETSQLLSSPPPGPGVCVAMLTETSSSCDNVTCCDHWPVERDTQWSHAPLSLVTRLPWGDLCPASQWPLLSAHGSKLTPVICHLSSRTSGETKPFKATQQEYQTGQGWDRDMPQCHIRDGNEHG